MKNIKNISIGLLIVVALQACTTITQFSETAYKMSTSLKVDTLAIMDKAVEPYQDHKKEVSELEIELKKAQEYANQRENNDDSINQWKTLLDPNKKLVGGFLQKWKNAGPKDKPGSEGLNATFVQEDKGEIAKAFDYISGLESGKNKPKN